MKNGLKFEIMKKYILKEMHVFVASIKLILSAKWKYYSAVTPTRNLKPICIYYIYNSHQMNCDRLGVI